jgi:hypothetical protein
MLGFPNITPEVAAGVNEISPAVVDRTLYGGNVAIDEGTEDTEKIPTGFNTTFSFR